jgi:Tfp pilus assembly protein PilE
MSTRSHRDPGASAGLAFLEAVMVVLLACVLAALAAPRYIAWSSEARRSACWDRQAEIHAAVAAYAHENNGSMPDSLVPVLFESGTIPTCPDAGTILYTRKGRDYTISCTMHGALR